MFISTVAGTGASGYSGDGGPATNASLNYPQGVMVDAAGNLFIANTSDNRIRKVGADGNITTVAGNGTEGYSGDGGTATNASLNLPSNVAMDASGNLFIADTFNCVIRKVDTNGTITTVAGNGPTLRAFPGFSGDGSPATNASLYETSGVAVDASGNLYLSDTVGNEAGFGFVRKVDTNGFITTIAGNGIHGYSGDGGAATNASMTWPYGVAVDASGNLFIADFYYPCVRKVGTNGIITTVTGKGTRGFSGDGGAATNASLWAPSGIAVDNSGNLFIADTGNGRIRKVNTNGIITTVAGGAMNDHGDGVVATNTTLNTPYDVAVDAADNLFIADTYNQRVRLVNSPQWPKRNCRGCR
jgi:sugar lactone lactonase YvrE